MSSHNDSTAKKILQGLQRLDNFLVREQCTHGSILQILSWQVKFFTEISFWANLGHLDFGTMIISYKQAFVPHLVTVFESLVDFKNTIIHGKQIYLLYFWNRPVIQIQLKSILLAAKNGGLRSTRERKMKESNSLKN